jgi:hypothetical protein
MSVAEGGELLGFVREVKKFSVQLANLLAAADELMDADGWELATSQNIAFTAQSASLAKPQQWFLNEAFRFYRKPNDSRINAMVSILLDSHTGGDYELTEPLITAGWLRRAADTRPAAVGSESWWYSRAHGYAPAGTAYGAVARLEPRLAWPKEFESRPEWYAFDRVDTFAAPLAAITSTEALEERIVRPLLSLVGPLLTVSAE